MNNIYSRIKKYKAIQFNGNNINEIKQFFKDYNTEKSFKEHTRMCDNNKYIEINIFFNYFWNVYYISLDGWITIDLDDYNIIKCYTNKEFNSLFKKEN